MSDETIGIIGGIGPEAGIHITSQIYRITGNRPEEERPNVILYSLPGNIPSRNDFLIGQSDINPGYSIGQAILQIHRSCDCSLFGIACNSAHDERILEAVFESLGKASRKIKLINLVESAVSDLKIGTTYSYMSIFGTYISEVYDRAFEKSGVDHIRLPAELAANIHELIWNKEYGLKFTLPEIKGQTKEIFSRTIDAIRELSVTGIVLACTELPLLVNAIDTVFPDLEFVDANISFANHLVRASSGTGLN